MSHRFPHNPAGRCPEPIAPARRSVSTVGLVVLVLSSAPSLGGCSMSYPIASLVPASDDVTGSLSKVPFGPILDEEDRRREKAAMATALDPQGDGSPVHWENPKSGNAGSVVQETHAFPRDGKICRGFTATLKTSGANKTMGAGACAVAAGDWIITDTSSTR